MTLTAAVPRTDGGAGPADRPDRRAVAEHVTVITAVAWWGFVLTHGAGGRNAWSLTLAAVPALVALIAVRPWRRSSPLAMSVAVAVAVAPSAVCLIDPPGWFGAVQAATYAYSAVLFIVVRSYCRTAGRRLALVALVLGAGVAQVAWSLIAWVGGGDPHAVLSGTFYWYNQFAAFLLAPAVIGAGLATVGRGNLRLAGAVTAVVATSGVVLSTSRASMVLLAAGWLAVGIVAIGSQTGVRARSLAFVRWVATAAVAAIVTWTLPGPPLFPHRVSALASTAARNSQESIGQNGGYRVEFWKQSVAVFRHHPLTGGGFGSFGTEAGRLYPTSAHSALVHSGLLQPLSDGGLLLGLPFLLACVLVGIGLARRVLPGVWQREHGLVAMTAVAAGLTTAHSAVDFDWTYPSLMALTAILAGVALSSTGTREVPTVARARSLAAVPVYLLLIALVVAAVPARAGGWRLTAQPRTSVPTVEQLPSR